MMLVIRRRGATVRFPMMREALLMGIRMHAQWLFEALDARGRYLAPLRPRRLVLLLVLYPLHVLLQMVHWLGFLLDELFFHRYREIVPKEPLIVTGIPGSGIMWTHRVLASASDTFTCLRTWEVLLAPSISERHVLVWLARMDRRIRSRPLHRLFDALDKRLGRLLSYNAGFGLRLPAEDSLVLLMLGAHFPLISVFPASRDLWQLARFQEMPEHQRRLLVDFHKACLQKHLYWTGKGKRLLSSNSAFGSWLPDIRFAYPDARYLFCIREPGPALVARLRSLHLALALWGTGNASDTCSLELQTVMAHVYRILLKEKQSFFVDHLAVVDHEEIKKDRATRLVRSLKQLCIPVSGELSATLTVAAEGHPICYSERHPPLQARSGPKEFNTLVGDIYREILAQPHMVRDPAK
jgi:hypothetical protein